MNRSIVITRYATALVKYVRETGQGEIVCSEAARAALEKRLGACLVDEVAVQQSYLGQRQEERVVTLLNPARLHLFHIHA